MDNTINHSWVNDPMHLEQDLRSNDYKTHRVIKVGKVFQVVAFLDQITHHLKDLGEIHETEVLPSAIDTGPVQSLESNDKKMMREYLETWIHGNINVFNTMRQQLEDMKKN